MKHIIITALTIVALTTCSKEIIEPVDSCNFSAAIDNATHPLNDTYQAVLDEYCARGLPGLSLIVETPGEGLWAGAAGMARIEEKIPMQPCHLHHSASIAKTYIATLVLRLVEDGKLDLDDPARDYLPSEIWTQITNAGTATIRQLLNHTSGIYNFDDNMKVYVDTFNDPLVNPDSRVLFEKYVYGVPSYFDPGEDYHYSNTGYSLLGMIIEEASGMSLGDYMEQEILGPLNTNYSIYKATPGYPDLPNVVNSYFEHFPKEIQNCTDIQKHFSSIAYGHEGMIASPYDYAMFMKQLVTGGILSPVSTAEMMEMDADEHYGLGIAKYKTDYETGYGHAGGSIGTISYAIYFPESETAFSICCNLGAVFASENTKMFYDDLYDELIRVIFTGERE